MLERPIRVIVNPHLAQKMLHVVIRSWAGDDRNGAKQAL